MISYLFDTKQQLIFLDPLVRSFSSITCGYQPQIDLHPSTMLHDLQPLLIGNTRGQWKRGIICTYLVSPTLPSSPDLICLSAEPIGYKRGQWVLSACSRSTPIGNNRGQWAFNMEIVGQQAPNIIIVTLRAFNTKIVSLWARNISVISPPEHPAIGYNRGQ
jgi:hypothetical protein